MYSPEDQLSFEIKTLKDLQEKQRLMNIFKKKNNLDEPVEK